ncbi:hypothetical protein [Nocardioides sp. TF02-7]|uniref:hypothetical protein n=1 Tax=Nocardioides sp. TF02-7 TaxID=2917724 RepID=UPI001F0517AB|nr:hypothetical protein [Nocardioides sp. TF02-7]UMG91039.1 hypothetical protein MF408_12470 [Nocardioides sp. TF02-7]
MLLHLLRHGGLDVDGLEDLLHHRSGLEGLAGGHDVRDLVRRLGEGDPDAGLAWDVYCRRIRKYVGAYLAVLGGADAVAFTAGVGEHVPAVRRDALAGLEPLGVVLDPERNEACAGPRRTGRGVRRPVRRHRAGGADQRGARHRPRRGGAARGAVSAQKSALVSEPTLAALARAASVESSVESALDPGHVHPVTTGWSSPCLRVWARAV